ncbi:taste receptor type 2 member 39-like [Mantella aurantiaca]
MALPIFVAIAFLFTTSMWLTASLCFFYYVKIQTFTSDFLSRLKTKISSLVPWMIFMSVALSCFSSSLTIIQFVVDNTFSESVPVVHSINMSGPYRSSAGVFDENLYTSFICSFIPFLISVVTTASTTFSLHLHRLTMRKNKTPSSSQGRVNTYEDTIRIMIRLLIFYAMTYVVLFLFYFNTFAPYSVGFWVFLVIMCAYSPTQSILLSLATTKLKKAWMKILHLSNESGKEEEHREE